MLEYPTSTQAADNTTTAYPQRRVCWPHLRFRTCTMAGIMRTLVTALVGCLVSSVSLLAQVPVVTSIQNPASNILPGQPNFGIPQGSIFVLYGSGLGPSTISIAPTLPYSTTLGGTSITVTAGGLTFSPYIIYTLNTQVAAVMPSNVVLGSATIKVTEFGLTSAPFSTTIVQNNFGVSTVNQTGTGAAVLTYPIASAPFYAVVSSTNSAIPGNTYTMWGTGLGPATGGNSDNNVNAYANVGPQVTVLVGGISAAVTYYGRSPGAGPGLDQINFTIPAGLTGCNVSLVVQTTGTPATLSNNTTVPISANGGVCTDANSIQAATWAPLLAMSGGINLSFFQLSQTSSTLYSGSTPTTKVSSLAIADFIHFTQAQLTSQYQTLFAQNVSLGSCAVTVNLGASSGTTVNYTGLNAGQSVNLNSFTGAVLPLGEQPAVGFYQTAGNVVFPTGTYTISDGTGGTGVGVIGNVGFSVPTYTTWSNETTLATNPIIRANGVSVTWTGGTSSGYIDIQGSAPFGNGNSYSVNFECAAPASAGQFTVPASVLLALPANPGSLQVENNIPGLVTVPGMNIGAVATDNIASTSVTWN